MTTTDQIEKNADRTERLAAAMGRELAKIYFDAAGPNPYDDDGCPLWPAEPLDSDWDELEKMMGERMTAAVEMAFQNGYCDEAANLACKL
ncbi:MAG: hypothetical protein V1755_05510 [Chloroflexota bacterium]